MSDKKQMVKSNKTIWIVSIATAVTVLILVGVLIVLLRNKKTTSSKDQTVDNSSNTDKSSTSNPPSDASSSLTIPKTDLTLHRLLDQTQLTKPFGATNVHMDSLTPVEGAFIYDKTIGKAWSTAVSSDMIPIYRLKTANTSGGFAGRCMSWKDSSYNVPDQDQNPNMILDRVLFYGYASQKSGTVPFYSTYRSLAVNKSDFMSTIDVNEGSDLGYNKLNSGNPICYIMPADAN
jgi:hypothetical protein